MLDLVGLSVSCSCCNICNNCLAREFSLVEDILDILRDHRLIALEELRHLPERKPGGLAGEADLDSGATVLGLVEEELATGVQD